MEARTATGGFRGRRPIAVAGLALGALLSTGLFLPSGGVPVAGADQPGPDQAQLAALTAKINGEAAHIHQITEQLDQARLQVSTTSSRLAGVTRQHLATAQVLDTNRAILLEQAVRAYMHGGVTPGMAAATGSASDQGLADVTLGREYLRVASGDLVDTGDQLRQLEADQRRDQAALQGAQHANLQATAQLQVLRTNAISVATKEQIQLDSLQTQLAVQARAAATSRTSSMAAPQGLPVNNGLLAVVQQAAGAPAATPASTAIAAPPAPPAASSGAGGTSGSSASSGGHAGGVWLALRRCESSDSYDENTGNGYYGAYQFSQSTWSGLGFPGRPDQESPAMQDDAAMKLQAASGWGQWPTCAAALGLT